MQTRKVVIVNPTGLGVEAAGQLCRLAVDFKSVIELKKETYTANAKSVLSVLGAGIQSGEELELTTMGVDEEEAIEKIAAFIAGGNGSI